MNNKQPLSSRQSLAVLTLFTVTLAISFVLFATGTAGLFAAHAAQVPGTQLENKGEWTAETSTKYPDRVQLTFQMRSSRGDYNNTTGESFRINELEGLSSAAINSSKTEVRFNLTREAGTIACEGYFSQGRGTGLWTYTRNEAFASAMKSRGYGYLNDDEMLRATLHNLTGKFIDEIKSAGYADLEFDQLVRAAGHEITPSYIKDLRNAGFDKLSFDDLIRAHNHEIDSAYVREVKAMGFEKQDLDSVIRMKNHEITPDYISRMKGTGFKDLTIDNLIRLKNHEVTPEYVADIKAEGFANLDADTAIRLKSRDIDRDFIRRAKAQGYQNATLDELIRLNSRGTIK